MKEIMKEIKFRGKHHTSKQWLYGYYVVIEGLHHIISKEQGNDLIKLMNTPSCIIPRTVGQYAFNDKNGEECYADDIIRWVDEERAIDEIGVLVFEEGTYKLKHPMCYAKDYDRSYDEMITFWKDGVHDWESVEQDYMNFQKIGNIHDNPELLEEK